jgi:hypothetical protein
MNKAVNLVSAWAVCISVRGNLHFILLRVLRPSPCGLPITGQRANCYLLLLYSLVLRGCVVVSLCCVGCAGIISTRKKARSAMVMNR